MPDDGHKDTTGYQ